MVTGVENPVEKEKVTVRTTMTKMDRFCHLLPTWRPLEGQGSGLIHLETVINSTAMIMVASATGSAQALRCASDWLGYFGLRSAL
eukprot:scaffold15296_cov114-Cylindrotheca_fusiformis.AAC.2